MQRILGHCASSSAQRPWSCAPRTATPRHCPLPPCTKQHHISPTAARAAAHSRSSTSSSSGDEEDLFWRESWAQDTTVSQVMNSQVAVLTTSMLVRDAIRLFLQQGISGAPVVDEDGKLVGVLSEKDIIVEASESDRDAQYGERTNRFMPFVELAVFPQAHSAEQQARLHEFLTMPVVDVMSSNPITCAPSNLVVEAAGTMALHEVTRLPVVDGNDNVVGIITRGDVLQTMIWQMLVSDEAGEAQGT